MSTVPFQPAEKQYHTFTVVAAGAVTANCLVEQSGAETTVQNCATPDLGIGIAKTSATAGQQVEVYLLGSVVRVLVGAGGATFGNKAVQVGAGAGFTNAPAAAAGATSTPIWGTFLQTGAAGSIVGMLVPGGFNRESA